MASHRYPAYFTIRMAQKIGVGGPHDVGGLNIVKDSGGDNSTPKLDLTDKPNSYWETCIHALLVVLSTKQPPLATTDQLRRCVEGLEPEAYASWGYYDKWAVALTTILLEIGAISQEEVDAELNGDAVKRSDPDQPIYKVGDVVRIRTEDSRLRWRRPHIRCPGYIFGQVATIEEYVGPFKDPFLLAYRCTGVKQHLYRVSMDMGAVWKNTGAAVEATDAPTGTADKIQVDIYEGWLEPYEPEHVAKKARHEEHTHDHEHSHEHSHGHEHGHEHGHHNEASAAAVSADTKEHQEHKHEQQHVHDHDHGHTHQDRYEVECVAADREAEDADRPGKVVGEALLRLLYRKGVVTQAEIHRSVEALETANVSLKAADLVVYAWKDPAFKERLIADARAAALEFGMATSNQNAVTVLRVVANTPTLHNLIVCTLCSCYPVGLLGFSPAWYKSRAYRSRVVREPRKVLSEFGLELPATVTIRVHDSTADCRYFVLPLPPAHLTEQDLQSMSHEQLKALVSRDSMIGVALL